MNFTRRIEDHCIYLTEGTNVILKMKETKEDDHVNVILEGSLKSDFVYDFQDEMITLILLGLHLKLDFAKVTYLSPTCTSALLRIQQKIDSIGKGSLILSKMPAVILEELESIGFSELLMIEG